MLTGIQPRKCGRVLRNLVVEHGRVNSRDTREYPGRLDDVVPDRENRVIFDGEFAAGYPLDGIAHYRRWTLANATTASSATTS